MLECSFPDLRCHRARLFPVILAGVCAASPAFSVEVTVQVQMAEYAGKEAYFALYLVDPDSRYVETLHVSGPDDDYHEDLARWWRYLTRSDQDIAPITGPSIKSGERRLITVTIDDAMIDAGYSLRLETAVEEQQTVPDEAEISLTEEGIGARVDGSTYVRFIRYQW
ncbi:DUF2271 domain-containing protein [Pacificibacter sp. AS14]|uniref:DUF2271 domain-containing protein n=1 Tax=Pacificibacter sp. AS14 TaxID=3135785 RepID=UPI00316BA664